MMSSSALIITTILLNLVLFLVFVGSKTYHPFFVFLHLVTLIALWAYVLSKTRVVNLARTHWKESLLLLILFLVALFVRLYRIEELTPGMYGDEIMVADWGLSVLKLPTWPPFAGDLMHTTPLMYLTGFFLEIFGHTMTAIRLHSIVFGALTVTAFYILLRLFFPLTIAFLGAVLMIFQYTQIILSRLAYEPMPSLFFQAVALIFFALFHKTKEKYFLYGIALSLGAGFYTYLNFRTFALFLFALTLFLILRKNIIKHVKEAILFGLVVFVSAMPFFSYAIVNPSGFWGHTEELSIFGRNYSPSEFNKELWGNLTRAAILPFFSHPSPAEGSLPMSGDPNPGKNPSGAAMLDPLTVIIAMFGFIYLFIHRRSIFWLMLILLAPPLISDVFSTEIIPEFHYYGLGHPNALRTSGFILIILFSTTACFYWAYSKWSNKNRVEILTALTVAAMIISFWNWNLYFDQKNISPNFYIYNYTFNHGRSIQTAKYLNKAPGEKIFITKDLAEDSSFKFFISPRKKISTFDLKQEDNLAELVKNNDITVIGVTETTIPILQVLNKEIFTTNGFEIHVLNNPFDQANVLIIGKPYVLLNNMSLVEFMKSEQGVYLSPNGQ